MFLKSLELHGFKSFPEKTVLNFDSGTTVIVGPNGSGKSNITDAMRWVLGELSYKTMRGSKMEDVIFVGTDDRRPMSFAEVSVTFDNTDPVNRLNTPYDEITVTRRYYRAGESEYYINRKPCRLRDINELFMNTGIGREGYSIIGQGKIAEIISKKNEDRRGIFEETAGISKFRYRKQESEKRLKATEENMSRVADILYELERQIPTLERDSQKARKYLELFEEKKRAEVSLWLYDIEKINADLVKTLADCEMSAHEYDMAADSETQLEAQNDRLYSASMDNKQSSQRVYERIKELREKLHSAENELTLILSNSEHAKTDLANAEKMADAARDNAKAESERIEALMASRVTYEEKSAAVEAEAEGLKADKLEVAVKRSENEKFLEDKLAELRGVEAELTDLRVRMNVLKTTLTDNDGKETDVSANIAKYENELREISADAEMAEESSAQYRETLAACTASIADIEERIAEAEAAGDKVRRDLSDVTAERSAIESRIYALKRMQEHFDGYNNSVRYVMSEKAKGALKGIHGPISHIIKADEANVVAVETALGSAMQNIVVNDETAAKNAIYALKNSGSGRATFYPLTSVKGQGRTRELEAASRAAGFIGFGDELVSCDAKYADIIASLLGRVAVFDNIDHATDAARAGGWRFRAVTLDGQQINAGGSFTGGSVKRESGMLTRNLQIDKLNGELSAAEKKAAKVTEKLEENTKTIEKLRSAYKLEDERRKLTDVLLSTELTQLGELDARRGVTEKLLIQLTEDSRKLAEFKSAGSENIAKLEGEEAELQAKISAISDERNAADVVRHELEDEFDRFTQLINDKAIELATIAKDAEVSEEAVREAEAKREAFMAEEQSYLDAAEAKRADIAEYAEAFAAMTEAKLALANEVEESENEREKLEEGGLDYEKRLNEIRAKLREISAKKEIIFKANAKNESKRDQLTAEIDKMVAHLWEEYELTNTTAAELGYPEVTADNRSDVAARFAELRVAVKALGHVNIDAIENYSQVKERYDTIKVQMDDLQKSKDDLENIIAEIETEMKRIFVEAFEQINKNFGKVFRELFGGGHAELTLSDPSDVLNCGIEITAAPPGKMIKSLSLLSGGEQAFVAIALLFALIKVNPSPFCIFDEIEAALDEVNVARVAKYVQQYSKDIQIIMITHRRGTMEIADTLYGVTMPNRGVSKVFSLDVGTLSDNDEIDDLVE